MWGGVHKPYVTYIHVIKGGTVTNVGDVFESDYKLLAPTCAAYATKEYRLRIRPQSFAHHDEVFVISQFWGKGYYHVTMEDLPRLALFLSFLRRNQRIKIRMIKRLKSVLNFLEVLGINANSYFGIYRCRCDISAHVN